jgi:NAD(P)-dependent dehydrogenase (short-subunit alcohol dehydrogenase family)
MKNAIVTGSNTGIGYGCALDLARKGYHVHAGTRALAKGEALKAEADSENLELSLLELDVNDSDSMKAAVESVIGTDGKVDVLVNNAGIAGTAPAEFVDDDTLRGIMETNFFGAYKMMQLVIPGMRERMSGAIINISSIAGIFPNPMQSVYNASKFALEGASHAIAGELAPFKVRVVCVEPGVILTPIFEKEPEPDASLLQPPFPYHRNVRRLSRIFENGLQNPAYPQDVADVVYEAISSDSYRQRYLVGKDAEALAAILENEPLETLIETNSLDEDQEYFARLSSWGYPIA